MSDPRPADCRFRLQDEGRSYPRSGCVACGKTITTGLGVKCSVPADSARTREAALQRDNAALLAEVERLEAEFEKLRDLKDTFREVGEAAAYAAGLEAAARKLERIVAETRQSVAFHKVQHPEGGYLYEIEEAEIDTLLEAAELIRALTPEPK